MIDHIKAPEIFVFSENKRECYGVLRNAEEFTEDIRFNTCSEVHLKVAEKICDPLTGEWITNPVYKHLEKNNLLYLCDDNEYFSFPNRPIRDDYAIKTKSDIPNDYGRKTNSGYVSMTYENDNTILTGFRVQPETDLLNISVTKGYNWWNLSELDEDGVVRKNSGWDAMFFQVVCNNFVPIKIYDVISLRTSMYKNATNNNIKFYKYHICFYSAPDPNTILAEMDVDASFVANIPCANPVYRFNVNSILQSDLTYVYGDGEIDEENFVNFKRVFAEQGGYIRISAYDNYYLRPDRERHVNNNSSSFLTNKKKYPSYNYVQNGTKVIGWSFPYDGWVKIYSGKRFCSKVENVADDGTHSVPLRWFVIVDAEDDFEDGIRIKTVTAYSYEYTISNRTISLSEDTLPFYIPPQITNIVNSDNWIIDKESGTTSTIKAKQYMTEGLLNKVLDILPEWKVGHISSALMTRYRQIDDVNNSNLYSFLMNDVETLYQCYFVFDCDTKTISAYTQEDVVKNSSVILNWQNALKSLKITDQDKNFVTALRIHTADDTYGVGLVNPTGNSIIYNFDSVLSKMNFVADTSDNDPLQRNKITENGVTRNRTLKEAVETFMKFTNKPKILITERFCTTIGDGDGMYGLDDTTQHDNIYSNRTISISSLRDYRDIAKKFVECNLDKIKNESALEQRRTDYLSVLNKIATEVEYTNTTKSESEHVYPYSSELIQKPAILEGARINPPYLKPFGNITLFTELHNAAKQYHATKAEYEAKTNDYNSYKDVLVTVASKSNLNYYKQVALTNQYKKNNNAGLDTEGNPITLSLLTPAEILALQPFIREGDWTNDNTIFSEDYDAKDIINTLVSAFDQAKSDMDTFLSKPSYEFESDVVNWTIIPEMQKAYKSLKLGQTVYINTIGDEYVMPLLLELHINHRNKDDFTMQFTTDYKKKVTELRFYDLYSTINQISATDSTFTFNE